MPAPTRAGALLPRSRVQGAYELCGPTGLQLEIRSPTKIRLPIVRLGRRKGSLEHGLRSRQRQSDPFVIQQRSHDSRLKSLLGVEAVAHGAVVQADRGCRRRVEQGKAMPGKQLGHLAAEVCPEESMARIGLELREHFGRKRWKVPDDQHVPGLICSENLVEQRHAVS